MLHILRMLSGNPGFQLLGQEHPPSYINQISSDIAKSPQGVWVGNKIFPGSKAVSFLHMTYRTVSIAHTWLC